MNIMSGSAGSRGVRVEVTPLVYVNFPADSVFLLNLSERGMAVQAMEVLQPGRTCDFSFPLPEADECEVAGNAKVVWADRSGRAGLEFTSISAFDRFKLQQWIVRNVDQPVPGAACSGNENLA